MFFIPSVSSRCTCTEKNLGVWIHPVQEKVSDCSALWMFSECRQSSTSLWNMEAIKGETVPSCFLVVFFKGGEPRMHLCQSPISVAFHRLWSVCCLIFMVALTTPSFLAKAFKQPFRPRRERGVGGGDSTLAQFLFCIKWGMFLFS